jgi:hypothetical protein
MVDSMLSTIDNPYSPFDEYDDWYTWDTRKGYHTASFLARVALVSDNLSDVDYDLAIEQAIDEIVDENVSGLYIKVLKAPPSPTTTRI